MIIANTFLWWSLTVFGCNVALAIAVFVLTCCIWGSRETLMHVFWMLGIVVICFLFVIHCFTVPNEVTVCCLSDLLKSLCTLYHMSLFAALLTVHETATILCTITNILQGWNSKALMHKQSQSVTPLCPYTIPFWCSATPLWVTCPSTRLFFHEPVNNACSWWSWFHLCHTWNILPFMSWPCQQPPCVLQYCPLWLCSHCSWTHALQWQL